MIACMYNRAVWVTDLENYSVDAVLSGMSRLKSRFGQFKPVYSDLGTKLIAAGRLNQSQDEDDPEFEGGQEVRDCQITYQMWFENLGPLKPLGSWEEWNALST